MLKRKSDKVDIDKLNEGIKTGVFVLKIFLLILVISGLYIITLILGKWKVIPFIIEILKVISPLFIGIIVAWLLDPFVTKLHKKGVNRTLGTIFTYVILIIALVLLISLMFNPIKDQINDIVSATPSFINYLRDGIDGIFENISNLSGYSLESTKEQVYDTINNLGVSLTIGLPNLLMNFITSIINGGINLVFGLIVGFYMLFDFGNIRKHFLSIIPAKYKGDTEELIDKLNKNLKDYVHGTLLIMAILFTFQSIGLSIAGMKAPLVFGLFCAITNVIPYFGPYIGGIPTVLVAFSVSPMVGFLSLVSVLLSQVLESYFLQPIVMGKSMSLHPVTIMLGLLIFGHFFGIIGMILATPIIAVLKTLFTHYNEKYKLLARVISDDNEDEKKSDYI